MFKINKIKARGCIISGRRLGSPCGHDVTDYRKTEVNIVEYNKKSVT
jgi:hypothetical protein